jgi:hypothetical protein
MPIIDIIALFVAVLALWFTINEARKNNCIILDIKKCEGSSCQSIDENKCQYFHYLKVLIRNKGIALFNVQLALTFQLPNYGGEMSFFLKRKDDNTLEQNNFSRGMIAEFDLKSYLCHPHTLNSLMKLTDLAKQNACFRIYSQGYLAKEIRVSTQYERLKLKWNHWAYLFNKIFDKTIEREGNCPLLITSNYLPKFNTVAEHVKYFISCLKEDSIIPKE